MKRWRIDVFARCGLIAASFAIGDVAVWPHPASADSTAPVARNFSRDGLERVSDYIRHEIAAGTFPGAILMIQ
jgi:hypothetical protein